MDIRELKNKIDNKTVEKQLYIFKYLDIDFLPLQYIHEICKILDVDIDRIDDLKSILNSFSDLFGEEESNIYKIYFCDELDICDIKIKNSKDLCIICKKIEKNTMDFYSEFITEFPKLDDWQIKDYVYSVARGVDTNLLDLFIKKCGNDIFVIDNELDKIRLFDENGRKYSFEKFIDENLFSHISEYKIFDFINCIIKKDRKTLLEIYKNKDNIDIEPLGVLTLLYNNFKNIIKIQLTPNATPENTKIPSKQFWAIKYNCTLYQKSELIRIFQFLCSLDRKVKSGILPMNNLIDYILVNILR